MFFRCKKSKGSLTVEACLALPVFLIFFYLLLFLTKVACLHIILDQAVKETARQLAAVAYPLRFLNEQIDLKDLRGENLPDFFKEKAQGLETSTQKMLEKSLLDSLLSGKVEKADLGKIWGQLHDQIKDEGYNLVEGALLQVLEKPYFALKEGGQSFLAQKLLEEQLAASHLDLTKLVLLRVELPQSNVEYQQKKALWPAAMLQPDQDFGPDDVVLEVAYRAVLPLPWGALQKIQLVCVAVERAWLYGGNGFYALGPEGIDFTEYADSEKERDDQKEKTEYVYICRSPTEVYHRYRDCRYLYDKTGVRKITLQEAKERGLRAHAGCPELFK